MGDWVKAGEDHLVQVFPDGTILWEHKTHSGYDLAARHMVSARKGAKWTVVQADPLTLTPSLHCDPSFGGCGVHGFITNGKWVGA